MEGYVCFYCQTSSLVYDLLFGCVEMTLFAHRKSYSHREHCVQ